MKWVSLQVHISRMKSIFPRIILMFLAVLIPINLLTFFLVRSGQESIRKELTSSFQSRVHLFISTLEREFDHIQRLQLQLVDNYDLLTLNQFLPVITQYQLMRAVDSLYSNLVTLRSSSDYIRNVSVHLTKLDRTLSTSSYFTPLFKDKYNMLQAASIRTDDSIISWNNGLYLYLIYPKYRYDQQPDYIIEVELSTDRIEHLLELIFDSGHNGVLLHNDVWTISHNTFDDWTRQLAQTTWGMSETVGMFSTVLNDRTYLVNYEYSSVLDVMLTFYTPKEEVTGPLRFYNWMYGTLLLVSSLMALLFSVWIYRYIHHPLIKLLRYFRIVEKGDEVIKIEHSIRDEFYYVYDQFNIMVQRLKTLIKEAYEQKIRLQQSELKQLQSNIHPHFLYNTFYIIYRMARAEDLEMIIKITRHLGDYFRFISRSRGDEIPLHLEVQHSRNFVEILAFRFSNRVDFEFGELPRHWEQVNVPKLILQPIVENAFKHGLDNKTHGGKLSIQFTEEKQRLAIIVDDNGGELTKEKLKNLRKLLNNNPNEVEQTGLLNAHYRLQLKYGSLGGIEISQNSWNGLRVKIYLPETTARLNEGGSLDVSDSDR